MNLGSRMAACGLRWAAAAAAGILLPAAACALELNDASRAELERLDGLGVVMVERILAERDKAPFRNWRDFEARVKGIRGARAERLRAQGLTIGGRRDERDDVGTSNKP